MFDRVRTALWLARDTVRDSLHPRHREQVFTRIYDHNLWGDRESRSGAGSSTEAASAVVAQLGEVWRRFGIRTLVDAPCGDCHWMSGIAGTLGHYTGVDIVPALIESNRAKYPALNFACADLTSDALPKADAILCRDCFQHLPTRLILAAMANFKRSGATWVFLTTNQIEDPYKNVAIGGSRPVNLQRPPFDFPPPVAEILEDESGRSLGLWRLDR